MPSRAPKQIVILTYFYVIMFWISHRGNIYGREEDKENCPKYIWNSLREGYNVAIDAWFQDGTWMTGTEAPSYVLDEALQHHEQVWFHPMNEITHRELLDRKRRIYIPCEDKSSAHLPEKNLTKHHQGKKDIGTYNSICSNYIGFYKQRHHASVNIGVLIGGRLKCYEHCLLPQIVSYLRNNTGHWIDVFISINDHPDRAHEYLSYHGMDVPFIAGLWCTEYKTKEEYKTYRGIIHCVNVQNCMSMYYNNMMAMNMLRDYKNSQGVSYRLVMKYRPDIVHQELPITISLCRDMLNDTACGPDNNTIYMPKIRCYGYETQGHGYRDENFKYNDQIALGTYDMMETYCSIFTHIVTCMDERREPYIFHPETLLGYHLRQLGAHIHKFDYEYSLDDRRFQ